ncbi:FAD-dependent monooxygenase [Salsuginibacillus kocurii]|uniref:FAD-dependent monooxygenase n=1 Tax=Salsuginibacillus kocurii TaxID=427078 RepID=UPI000365FE2C|nr:FAD-dependent monooxygenase [Salsuginibacillus kocurii]
MSKQTQNATAIVVGAGPVGLTAALTLQTKGIDTKLIEADPLDRPRPGSRAIYLHNATLKLLESTYEDLGFTIAKNGIVWPVKKTLFKGKEVYKRDYGVTDPANPEKLPPFTALHQDHIEHFIYNACEEVGVEFVQETPIERCETSPQGVKLTSSSGDTWEADYVIGADGARSNVRKTIGVEFEGPRTNDRFLVLDVKEDESAPLPLERIFHYQHPAMGGRNVMHVPFKGGWRVDLQLLPDDEVESFSEPEKVKEWLPHVMPEKYIDKVTWVSTYRFHQVVANSFTDNNRRVLLAGEAAHLFAPFGARGLNSGVPDAVIAADRIHQATLASTEEARIEQIDKAAHERRTAALWNRDSSTTALHHLQSDSKEMNVKREIAASLTDVAPKLGRWLDEGPYGPRFGSPEVSTKY